MSKDLPKVDLTLLKKLVSELEVSLNAVEVLPAGQREEIHHFITEMSKTSGLAGSIAQEATALVKDMYQVIRMAQQPVIETFSDLLAAVVPPTTDDKNRN